MFNYSVDTILLANLTSLNRKTKRILEIGTNNCALSIFLSQRSKNIKIDAIEIQKEAIELLLESNVFALTFDVGHNHGIGGTDEEFIMKHKKRLSHIHLHDAQGRKNHLALGTGEMDIEKYLSLAKEQNCRVVLETKTIDGLKQSVEWLNKSI